MTPPRSACIVFVDVSSNLDSGIKAESLGVEGADEIPAPEARPLEELELGPWLSLPAQHSVLEVTLDVPALSFEVTHWMTTAENKTCNRYQPCDTVVHVRPKTLVLRNVTHYRNCNTSDTSILVRHQVT